MAIAFALEDAGVIISYLPEEQQDAEGILSLVRDAGRVAVGRPGDFKDPDFAKQLVETAFTKLGGLDILVTNAGKQ